MYPWIWRCTVGSSPGQFQHPMSQQKEKISVPILNSLPFQGTFFLGSVLSPEMEFLDKIHKIQSRPIWDRVKPNHPDLTDWIWRKNLRFIGWLKLGKKSTGEWSKQRNIEIAKNGMYKREMVRSNHGRLYATTTTTTTTRRRRNHQQTQKLQPFYYGVSVFGNQLLFQNFIPPWGITRHPQTSRGDKRWDCGCLSTSEKVTSRILGDSKWRWEIWQTFQRESTLNLQIVTSGKFSLKMRVQLTNLKEL